LSAGTPSRNASACGAHEAGGSASQIRQIGVEASDQRTTRPRRGPAEDSARRDRTRGQEGARARRRQGGQQARRREGPGASQKGQHRPDAANQDRETGDETRGTRRERGQARGPGIQNISPYCGTVFAICPRDHGVSAGDFERLVRCLPMASISNPAFTRARHADGARRIARLPELIRRPAG
jgi:hypothetical protein